MNFQRLGQELSYAQPRIESLPWILEYQLYFFPPGLEAGTREARDVHTVEMYCAAPDRYQLDESLRKGAFTGPAFAHNSEGFPFIDGKGDLVDDRFPAPGYWIAEAKVVTLELWHELNDFQLWHVLAIDYPNWIIVLIDDNQVVD